MPNVLPMEKKVAVISALAEGSGIRQIERITGVHRDTIMRLGVRVWWLKAARAYSTARCATCPASSFNSTKYGALSARRSAIAR